MQPDALGPTAPQYVPAPNALQPRPPIRQHKPYSSTFAIFVLVALVVALVLGVVIGRASSSTTTPVSAPIASTVGRLHVQSSPVDGNVVVDGRFAGVAPIERLDLDPGKHSVVIDAFGYQPYSGTLQIEPRGTLNLSITLAALGGDAPTSGSFTGAGTVKYVVVPASALLPARAATAPSEPVRKTSPRSSPAPSMPRRDCEGEKSRCRDGCSHAGTDCRFSCPTCGSCNTSMGDEECQRQCKTCQSGCEQNSKFCESSCDSQYSSCEASQP
jgi:PEGA domain